MNLFRRVGDHREQPLTSAADLHAVLRSGAHINLDLCSPLQVNMRLGRLIQALRNESGLLAKPVIIK
eukprot:7594073-Prorocentrum_lima.AAC.1